MHVNKGVQKNFRKKVISVDQQAVVKGVLKLNVLAPLRLNDKTGFLSATLILTHKHTIMKGIRLLLPLLFLAITATAVFAQESWEKKNQYYSHTDHGKLHVPDAEWKKILPAQVYNILREEGTEQPETGLYVHNYKKGTYYCAACGNALFSSTTKFDSHTGWPSFFQTLNKSCVMEIKDNSAGMTRTEIKCARCGGHLGHVFDDGPAPTNLRYCMNGYALAFEAGK